jgi:4a-hydroxytetrahydrobiopterin dehydratase
MSSWQEEDGQLVKSFAFPDFASALAFVDRIGALAEEANHHPDIMLGWGKVEVRLTSHDAGAVTNKDHQLAKEIDEL